MLLPHKSSTSCTKVLSLLYNVYKTIWYLIVCYSHSENNAHKPDKNTKLKVFGTDLVLIFAVFAHDGLIMTEPDPTYTTSPAATHTTTDAHLRDLLELKAIAAGTESEAYVWPKMMKRLQEMISQRIAELTAQADG